MNARKVPPALEDTLISGANALAEEIPVCLPSVAASAEPTTTAVPTATSPPPPSAHVPRHPKSRHGGKGHGHGKKH